MNQDQGNPVCEDSDIEVRYKRAQTIIQGYSTQNLVQNDAVFPHWIEETECFWYERAYRRSNDGLNQSSKKPSVQIGKEYRLVDAARANNQTAFDHGNLAQALAQASGQEVNPEDLPIHRMVFTLSPLMLSFDAFEKRWQFDATNGTCLEVVSDVLPLTETRSPDGKLIAFSRDHNLWVRDTHSGEERPLTDDGELDNAYGVGSSAWGMALFPEAPALWSPDSRCLLAIQRDKRQVKTLPSVEHVPLDGSLRPTMSEAKVAYPGDPIVETFRVLALHVDTGKTCQANYRAIPACNSDYYAFFGGKFVWWAKDSQRTYFIDQQRGDQDVRLVEFNPLTGATRVLFEELSDTHINLRAGTDSFPLHRVLHESNELIWWSERSGWGHLYLYDLNTGKLKHPITLKVPSANREPSAGSNNEPSANLENQWRVRDIVYVDETHRELWIQTSARVAGRDPYYRDICRVHIDTGEITTLISSDDDYIVHYPETAPVFLKTFTGQASAQTNGVAPNGQYLVTTRTRADQVPITLLMDREGSTIMTLETADISALGNGWQWPEPVKLLAADGHTDLYGLVFKPSDFSPDQQYPVLNYIVSAPWLSVVPKGSFHNCRGYANRHYFYGAALAELGFIVVLIDSRGTPLRSKAFQDESYGWIPAAANTDDHSGALQQLAARYPYMNMNKVGVFTPNGYRSGLQNFLERQDIYTVCVVINLMDNRLISGAIEGDKYEGCAGPAADQRYPEQLVDNLQGKLLLMHATSSFVSVFYPPAATFRVIEALQKANKNVDMLVVPTLCASYMMRRAWDYFVEHLQDKEPPTAFELGEVPL